MNNASITKKKEIMALILKFNFIIGLYNLYLFSIGNSFFNLLIGSMNIGVWTFFRHLAFIPINKSNNKNNNKY